VEAAIVTRIQNVFPPRAGQYFKGASSGTVDLRRDFKGFGTLLAYSVPQGTAVTAVLLPPVVPRALNNPFRAQITMSGTHDVVIFET
jgi:hypothetical protein